jgi:hypothetical protein
VVELLLNAGADINFHGCDEGTALTLACAANRFEIVKFLVRKSAAWSYTDETGQIISCYQRAARYEHIQRWLLVDRWTDQKMLYDHLFNQGDAEQEIKFWSGYKEISAPLFRKSIDSSVPRLY